jgi:putative ABC transport system permease protein
VKYVAPGQAAEPTFYMPLFGGLQQTMVVASSLANTRSILGQVRAAIRQVDPLVVVEPQPLSDIVDASLGRQRLGVTLMLLFAVAALLLAAIGIYGVIAYASTQRLGEVATRMALGATPSRVFWMLMNQGRTLSLIGASLGVVAAYGVGRVVASRLYEVRASDPAILVSAVVVVLAIALIAVLIPARRAAQIDVSRALRLE